MNRSFAGLFGVAVAIGTAIYAAAPREQAAAVASGETPAAKRPVATADPAHPVVLELYQSQGCSSCPPANTVLDQIANRPDVLALNFAVTYWDRLGWRDIYAQPAFTARQWDYSRAQGRSNVQTPQLIVNGRGAVLGSYRNQVEAAIGTFARPPGPEIARSGRTLTVAAAPAKAPATVWLVDYDPRTVQVAVKAGENGGRTLPHRDIVHKLTPIGSWSGKAATFALTPPKSGLVQAVLVQQGKGGPIVAARKL